MDRFINYGNFSFEESKFKKKQIILGHTSRDVEEYLTSLKFRSYGKYDKIPHFVISKKGDVVNILPLNSHTKFFHDELTNKNSIIILLENLGWLERKPLSNEYINWIGSIYKGIPYEKKWRDYFFWEPYTVEQFNKLDSICSQICDELKIHKNFIGINTKQEGIEFFEGIVSKSNYNSRFTDLNPSFDFENFLKKK
jgi:N-acetyl-anhydromuramyl-L-alanine amidase AmpD